MMPRWPTVRRVIFEATKLLRRRMECWSLPVVLLCTFVFLYLSLFRLPFTPIFGGGDENVFLLDATRMMEGQIMYRDFFELIAPGLVLVNVGFFKWFGVRAWVPNVALVLVGLGLTWVIVAISRKVLSVGAAVLPAALFLTYAFVFMFDDKHHWYSALAGLSAVWVVIEKRSPARLRGAGALCGLASFFTQTQGVFAVMGLAIFLLWEGRRAGQRWREIFRRSGYLFLPFVAVLLTTNVYFIWKAGLDRFLYCTVGYVWKYWSADREFTSSAVPLFEILELLHSHDLIYAGVFLFIHALLPWVYVMYWLRHRREALAPEQGNRLMLLNITGFFLFAAVVPSASTFRLCAVAPLGLILLVWLIGRWSKYSRVLTIVLWVGALCVAVAFPLRIQTQKMQSLDLPRGRLALDPTNYERLLWLSQHTVPGEFLFTAAGVEIVFPLGLRDPAEVPYVKASDYTRPEQVRSTVAALEKHCVRFVLSDPTLDFQGNSRSRGNRLGPPRGRLRSFFHVIKTFLVGDDRSKGDNLGPFRNYLHSRYRLAKILPDDTEVWERNP